jgi:hypothetical protein
MAKRKTADTPRAAQLQVVRFLTAAAASDTVYRDLYLQRAVEQLDPFLSRTEYEQLRGHGATMENLLTQTRRAVDRQDWAQVQQLTVRATGLRRLVDEKRGEMELAKAVYEAADVAIDPFSPGFSALFESSGSRPSALRDELVATLTALAKADAEWSDLYEQRRTYFAGISLSSELRIQQVAGDTANDLQQRMQRAAEKGDLEELNRLAGEMLTTSTKSQSETPAGGPRQPLAARRSAAAPTFAQPFPDSAVESAPALGFAYVKMAPQMPTLRQALSEFLDWYTWHPAFPATELAKEGSMHLRPLLKEALKDAPEAAELTEPLVEMAAQFSLHAYVNGGGARYLPILPDTEYVLIEDFPEAETPGDSQLLPALGLKQRSGLSRVEIEAALRQHGGQVIQSRLGLDPRVFRLVCVPFDVYLRVGRDRGWGQQQRWTHIDGYQIMQGGRLRALVGGDVRYGGLLDLCSISPSDQREGVMTRFAIIRRERLLAR